MHCGKPSLWISTARLSSIAGGGDIVDISDLLVRRRAELNAKSLLRILELATSTADLGLFNLINELSTEAIVIPLIGFLKKLVPQAHRLHGRGPPVCILEGGNQIMYRTGIGEAIQHLHRTTSGVFRFIL